MLRKKSRWDDSQTGKKGLVKGVGCRINGRGHVENQQGLNLSEEVPKKRYE